MTSDPPRLPLRWLHLSDFHLKGKDTWSQDVVLQSLLVDVSNRYSLPSPVDFIFVTGDLAFSGKQEEYVIVDDFLNRLLTETGVSAERLLLVPGNHDIDRNIEIDAFAGARSILKNSIEIDKFIGDKARRRTLYRRQSAFREFSNKLCGRDLHSESSYQHAVQYNLHGLNISVLLIDSSWLSEGGEADSHSILVGERQLIDMPNEYPESTLTIGLMHHPLDWLAPFEHAAIKNLLAERCHLLFRGHVHEDSVETITQARNQMKIFTAGASYESRLSSNCYGYGVIDLYTGDGECVIHKYRNDSKTWEKHEPICWSLDDQENFSVDFLEILNAIDSKKPPYPNYLSCLIGQKVMEIPVFYEARLIFIAFTDPIATSTPLAQALRRLRFLVHWKNSWNEERWRDAINSTVDSYSREINKCESYEVAKPMLLEREEHCTKIIQVLHMPSQQTAEANETVVQALRLAGDGSVQMGIKILERMLGQQGISDLEAVSAYRALAKIHLAQGNSAESQKAIGNVLQSSYVTGADYSLAAACSLNAEEYESALQHLESASSLGVPYHQIKGLAMRIAGLTGDADLLTRLRKSDA
ncbi:metallophosphoesterase [Candidatus Rariloculus sp.]|uniref:metallophosphoesterase n=1 Tax=Candidatus Rariloculus sp. TaxID=3101265 RepID=UPI003D0BAFCA